MKVIIAGSRGYKSEEAVHKILDSFFAGFKFEIEEVVSGGALGIDLFGESWARSKNINIKTFLPDYKSAKNKKYAPIERNCRMGDYADFLIAIWDGESPGTKHMIDYMTKLGKPCFVFIIPPSKDKQ